MITLGNPIHGWTEITFGNNGNRYIETVSDVPNDCLRDLTLATSRLLGGSLRETVEFSLEPSFLRCDLLREAEMVKVMVFEPERPVSAFSAKFLLRAFADQLHSEMVRIRSRYETEDGWTQTFPAVEVKNLEREMTD